MLRLSRLAPIALVSLLVACGGGAASSAADETVRPAGSGWFCHGAEHAAWCARTVVECEALRVDTTLDPGGYPCEAHAEAHCFTFTSDRIAGTHARCFDTAPHCEQRRGECTSDESCSSCAAWD